LILKIILLENGFNMNVDWRLVLLGAFYTFLAQAGAWAQHNLQFKFPQFGPNWWGWYLAAIPITWLFLTSTKITVEAFDGSIWANRFMGFSIGIIVYAILTQYFFGQPVTMKIFAQLLLAFGIIMIQLIWK
jgi:hypothetical protein